MDLQSQQENAPRVLLGSAVTRLLRVRSQGDRRPVRRLALRGVERKVEGAPFGELRLVAAWIARQGGGRLLERRGGPLLEEIGVRVAGVPLGLGAGELAEDLAGRHRLDEVVPVHLHARDLPVEAHQHVEPGRRDAGLRRPAGVRNGS